MRRPRCASTFKALERSFRRNLQRITCAFRRRRYFPGQRFASAFRSSQKPLWFRALTGLELRGWRTILVLAARRVILRDGALCFREVQRTERRPARNLQKRTLTSWRATHIWRLQQAEAALSEHVAVSRLFLVSTADPGTKRTGGRYASAL